MKVLITGAGGNVGSYLCKALSEKGFDVVGTDRHQSNNKNLSILELDLLDWEATEKAIQNFDAVIHFGNHSYTGHSQTVFNENCAMNMNVFQAAANSGAKKIIFASSIQVLASEGTGTVLKTEKPDFPSFPLNSNTPAKPSNSYALSKKAGEDILSYFSSLYSIEGTALRLPTMIPPKHMKREQPPSHVGLTWIRQAFAALSFPDTANLIERILEATLPGFRLYLPASKRQRAHLSIEETIERYYQHIPWGNPKSPRDRLIDISQLKKETGWEPEDEAELY
jgi:nucleoside-diphosphate-sugar epimerase